MGGGKSSTTTTSSTPWYPQGDALRTIFNKAEGLYNNEAASKGYQGDFTAGMTDTTRTAMDQTLAAAGAAGSFGDASIAQAGRLSGSYDQAKALTDAMASGDPVAQYLAQEALKNPTSSILSDAALYADNPYVSGLIDSVGRDVSRNLHENELTSLNLGASAAGNMNSSRAGAAEGVLMRGAQDRLADISQSVRGDAWNTGLAMAADQRQKMFANGLAASGQDINTKQQAVQNLMGLGGVGTTLNAMGVENKMLQGQLTGQVGAAQQQEEQRKLDEAKTRFEYDQNRPWETLGKFYGIVGDKSWGGQTSQTAPKSGGSGLQTALGALATVGGVVAAPFTGGASLAVTAAGVGMLGSSMAGGGGAAAPAMSYGGGGGGGFSMNTSPWFNSTLRNTMANPYGATGAGMQLRGSTGSLGGGV